MKNMNSYNSVTIQSDMDGRIIFKPLSIDDLKHLTDKRRK